MVEQAKVETFDQWNQDNQGNILGNIDLKQIKDMQEKIDANFLENLKNLLDKDSANELKSAIEDIEWYDVEWSNLNIVYNFIVSICNTFNSEWEQMQKEIKNNFKIKSFLVDAEIKTYDKAIQSIEYLNIIVKDKNIDSRISEIKEFIHWDELLWSTLVKIAEDLGIETKSANKYNEKQSELDNLWKKVFNVSSEKWLYRNYLAKIYNEILESDKIKNFKESPFDSVSLSDMCNLMRMEWNWEPIQEDNEQVIKFCQANWFDVKQFVKEFNDRNQERINNNIKELKDLNVISTFSEDELNKFSIINITEANSQLTQVQLKYWDIQLLGDGSNLISTLWLENKVKDHLKKDKRQTDFINETELINLINSDLSIPKDRFNDIFIEIEKRQQKPSPESPVDNQETQTEELRELDAEEIKNLRGWLDKKTVADFFNNAIKIKNITKEQKSLLLLTQKWLTTEEWRINDFVKELQTQLWFTWSAIDWKFGKNTFNELKQKFWVQTENPWWNAATETPDNSTQPWNNPAQSVETPTKSENSENIPDITINSINTVFSKINKQEIVNFFKEVKKKQNLNTQQKTLLQLAHTWLTTPREDNPDNIAYQAVAQLQSQLKITVDWRFGRNTFNKLKQEFWMYTPNKEKPQKQNTWPRENIDSKFNFNENNYKYYVEYHNAYDKDICATYAYWVVSDILASKWCCFPTTAVSSWNINGQRDIQDKFDINTLRDSNSKQQIINAPAWTFLTLKYDRTSHQDKGVSHVMVSLGNGVYTDLFWSKIRKIDFKSAVSFSWKKISFGGSSYTLSGESRLMSPKLWSFIEWSKETINKENVTPEQFAKEIRESTWADINYIKSLIAKDNNLSLSDFNTKKSKLSVKIIKKEVKDMGVENAEWSNDIAKGFLNWIKEKKKDIMSHFHNLTNHEYDEIARRAMWILYQESNSGKITSKWGLKYRAEEIGHSIADNNPAIWAARDAYWAIRWKSFSRWYTRIKYNDNFSANDKAFLKTLWVRSESNLVNAKKCGIATMVALINKYNQYVKPMKRDPFWINDAIITKIKFKDDKIAEIAKKKAVPMNGQRRVRTQAEIDDLIWKRANKHGWIKEQTDTRRPWIKKEQTFFDYLYYSRNKPSEIVYWTASLSDKGGDSQYVAQCNQYMDNYTQMA